MPEETTKHEGTSPINYPADNASGVSTPSDRLRRQMIKGGAGTVLAVAAVWAGWTKVLFPEGAAAPGSSPRPSVAGGAVSAPSPDAGQKLGAVASFQAGAAPKAVTVGKDNGQPYFVDNLGNGQFLVLSASCTHKGCPVDWSPKDSQYVCPCHNGRFSRDGKNVSGPPPSPLVAAPTRVENGELVLA